MGIFDFLKKPASPAPAVSAAPAASAGNVSLTKNEALNKRISLRKELVAKTAEQQNIRNGAARVVFALDHSGSMRNMYKNGAVQALLERIFPVAMHFDDNAEMEFYWFDNTYKELAPVNYDSIDGYVQREILSKNDHFGGTCFAPVMRKIYERYAMKDPSTIPTLVIFITDGSNSDKTDTKKVLTDASKHNIFWKYVGIGSEQFPFLERLDELKGRFIDNANFITIDDITTIKDETLYKLLLEEYGDWLSLCRTHGMIE